MSAMITNREDVPAYRYQNYTGVQPETCDHPGCKNAATVETFGPNAYFMACSLECADLLH